MKRIVIAVMSLFLLCLSGCSSAISGFSEKDLYLSIEGKDYRTGSNIQTIITDLGSQYEYSDGLSCAYDGLDKTYAYDTVIFYTNPLTQGDIVSEIYTDSPNSSTSKEITVGMREDDVTAAYGTASEHTENLMTYRISEDKTGTTGALCFEIENGVVIAIFITTQI